MPIIKNWKKYYTIEESKKITEKFILDSAEDLVLQLRKRKAYKDLSINKKHYSYS